MRRLEKILLHSFEMPHGRRYSPSLLAISALIQSISPAYHKQISCDGLLTLPCLVHLKRLSSAIDMDMDMFPYVPRLLRILLHDNVNWEKGRS